MNSLCKSCKQRIMSQCNYRFIWLKSFLSTILRLEKFAGILIIAKVIASFCNLQCILSRICQKKHGCTQTVTVSTKLRTVCPSPFFIWCKTVRRGELEAVVNLVGADFKQTKK